MGHRRDHSPKRAPHPHSDEGVPTQPLAPWQCSKCCAPDLSGNFRLCPHCGENKPLDPLKAKAKITQLEHSIKSLKDENTYLNDTIDKLLLCIAERTGVEKVGHKFVWKKHISWPAEDLLKRTNFLKPAKKSRDSGPEGRYDFAAKLREKIQT